MGEIAHYKNADVAKLADAQVSGSCGRPYGFESLHPHQRKHPYGVLFFVGADEGLTRFRWFARAVENGAALPRVLACEKRQIPFIRTNKSTNFDKKFVDFPYLYKLLMLRKKLAVVY